MPSGSIEAFQKVNLVHVVLNMVSKYNLIVNLKIVLNFKNINDRLLSW